MRRIAARGAVRQAADQLRVAATILAAHPFAAMLAEVADLLAAHADRELGGAPLAMPAPRDRRTT
jgi:hypothetical protein